MNGRDRSPLGLRVYRALLSLLPAGVSESDRSEMVLMLQDHLADTTGVLGRARVLARAYRRFLRMLLLEWAEALGWSARKSNDNRKRQGGMGWAL